MKQKKLLNKTLSYYLIFGGLMILIVMPSYYFFYNKYYVHEIDEYLLSQKENIYKKSLKTLSLEDIPDWNKYNDNEEIITDNGQTEENIYTTAYIYDTHEGEEEAYRVLNSKIQIEGMNHILIIRLSMFEAKKIIWSGTILQLVFFFLLLLGFASITRFIYKKLWKPFYRTLSDIEQFNIRSNEIPVFPKTDTQEFTQLNKVVEILINNSVQAYKTQKEFTENASHEMQTPLAIFQSKLDILLQQQDLTQEQLSIMQSLYDAASRLTRMNKNLLLLAKIDNLQFLETQQLNVSAILNEPLVILAEQAEANKIQIETNIEDTDLTVQANKTLLESLINNLIINAVRHNIPNGKISISLQSYLLTITNTGTDKPLDETIIFHRFGCMNEGTKGSGLGLAIVRQICSLYGWKISYTYQNGRHQFVIFL